MPELKKDTHGTIQSYRARKCRCDECRQSNRWYCATWNRDPAKLPHGTKSGYKNWGCRCELCKEAAITIHQEQKLRRQLKKVSI